MPAPALPGIAQELSSTAEAGSEVMALYLTGYALSVLAAGPLADRFGVRRVQSWGLGLFAAAAVGCAAAPSLPSLAAARFLQALGGGSATVLAP